MVWVRFFAVCSCLSLGSVGCGATSPDAATANAAMSDASSDAATAPAGATSPVEAPATVTANDSVPPESPQPPTAPTVASPPKRERIRIHNSCQKPVKLHIERVNDSDSDTSLTNNTEKEERGTDGDEVRLIGDNNAVLHTLKIEPSMKLVDVASSCTKLEGK